LFRKSSSVPLPTVPNPQMPTFNTPGNCDDEEFKSFL